jgi:thioesterase domain-containing protein
MAQQLNDAGEEVALVAILGAHAPGSRRKPPLKQRLGLHARRFRRGDVKRKIQLLLRGFVLSYRFLLRDYVRSLYAQMGSSKYALSERVTISARIASNSYRPRLYPGRVILFVTTDDSKSLEIWHFNPQWGWGNLARDGVDLHQVPSTHEMLLEKPFVGTVAKKLRPYLDEGISEKSPF